jgi:penicillin-binding protein 2
MVVNAAGTGGRARLEGYDVSGKTGTAQVVSNQNKALATSRGMDTRDNGWFIFFAPRDNPQIAGAIMAEHSMHGPEAAPIAKHVIQTFFAKKEGKPLPVLPAKSVTTPTAPATPNPGTRGPQAGAGVAGRSAEGGTGLPRRSPEGGTGLPRRSPQGGGGR